MSPTIREDHHDPPLRPRVLTPPPGHHPASSRSRTGIEWADPQHPLALFTYQTLSADDFTRFLADYIKSKEDWAPRDFGKPNIAASEPSRRTSTPPSPTSGSPQPPRPPPASSSSSASRPYPQAVTNRPSPEPPAKPAPPAATS